MRFLLIKRYKFQCYIALLLFFLSISIPLAISFGVITLSLQDVLLSMKQHFFNTHTGLLSSMHDNIIWHLRFPRVIMAAIAGSGLALTGLILQVATQNPLAEPHLFGVSSGAVLGAVITTMHPQWFPYISLPLMAFLGAMVGALAIYSLMVKKPWMKAYHLLMSGVAISFILMSASNLVLYLGDFRVSHQVIFWMLGGLGLIPVHFLWVPLLFCSLCFIFVWCKKQQMNAMLLGDETAHSLGVNVKRFRLQLFIVSALITSVIVSFTGMIGFIGLMMPHIGRYFVGGNIKKLIPVVALIGAIFLIWVDVLSRTLMAYEEIPVGIITAFVGGIFFIILLIKSE